MKEQTRERGWFDSGAKGKSERTELGSLAAIVV
jgi:hypothetical protein